MTTVERTFEDIARELSHQLDAIDTFDEIWRRSGIASQLDDTGAVSCRIPLHMYLLGAGQPLFIHQRNWAEMVAWCKAQYGPHCYLFWGGDFWAKTPEDLALFLLRWGTP